MQRILITGCSSGGKTTLIDTLARRGFEVVGEPGLRIIQSGGPKPWEDLPAFAKAATSMAESDLAEVQGHAGPVIFDRGLFDALSGMAARNKKQITDVMPEAFPYSQPVFYVPPWPEIFANTAERQLPIEAAIEEADRLKRDLDVLGIAYIEVPKTSPKERADFVLAVLGAG